jgi:hypothetical protein
MKKLNWMFFWGLLAYSFIAALIPGAIWLFVGLLVDGANWFMNLSWWVKIPTYLVVGLCLQFWRPGLSVFYPSNKEK